MIRRSISSRYTQGFTSHASCRTESDFRRVLQPGHLSFTDGKQPVFPSEGKRTDGILRRIIVRLEPTVLKITIKGIMLVHSIVDGFV